MATIEEQMQALQLPLKPDRVVWRVQQSGIAKSGKPWAMVLAYMDNRAVQERFDEVFGISGWKNEYKTAPDGGILCGISVKFGDEWVTKWDGAENTQVEAVKGGLSGAMKRAAVQWGVGRYLYDLPSTFAQTSLEKVDGWTKAKDGKTGKFFYWTAPQLPAWALPVVEKQTQKSAPKQNQPAQSKAQDDPLEAERENMVKWAGSKYGATLEEQKSWLAMPAQEAINDMKNWVAIKGQVTS